MSSKPVLSGWNKFVKSPSNQKKVAGIKDASKRMKSLYKMYKETPAYKKSSAAKKSPKKKTAKKSPKKKSGSKPLSAWNKFVKKHKTDSKVTASKSPMKVLSKMYKSSKSSASPVGRKISRGICKSKYAVGSKDRKKCYSKSNKKYGSKKK